jgi:cytochrome c-type biogenesis protein CcmH
MTRRALVLAAAVAVVATAAVLASARADGPRTLEERAAALAAELRCPVCDNLSVADSPSRLAGEMREEIATRLREGGSDDEVRAFFVDRYGEWVLLDPPRQGLNLVPFLFPIAAVVAGLALWVAVVRRRPPRESSSASDADRRRIERELAELGDAP